MNVARTAIVTVPARYIAGPGVFGTCFIHATTKNGMAIEEAINSQPYERMNLKKFHARWIISKRWGNGRTPLILTGFPLNMLIRIFIRASITPIS